MKVSAVVIAKNESTMITDCLLSLSWADEIVVVDTGSTDSTVKLSRDLGAKVFTYKGGFFSDWRSFAAKKTAHKWILYVDADERVTPLLAAEIAALVPGDIVAFDIPRKNIQLGKQMNHGGWPDKVKRLINKTKLTTWVGDLHEQPMIEGPTGVLTNSLSHITHRSITDMISKTIFYSDIEAKLMFDAHHPKMTIPRFMSAVGREFWYRGIRKQGFADGYVGIIEIVYQMFSRFVSYAKLWELQEGHESRNS